MHYDLCFTHCFTGKSNNFQKKVGGAMQYFESFCISHIQVG